MTIEINKLENGVHQTDKMNTALMCLVTSAMALGVAVDEEKMRQSYDEKSEMNIPQLLLAAKNLKLKAKAINIEQQDLAKCTIPAIAKLKSGNYVVLGQSNESKIIVFDPYQGHPLAIALNDFLAMWSGEVILLSPKFSIKNAGTYFSIMWFFSVLVRYKKIFAEVMVVSFFLQIFGLITPLFTQVIIDKVLVNNGVATLDVLALVLFICAAFQTVMGILRTYLSIHTTNKIDVILGTKLFRHIAVLPLKYFENRRVGDTLMRVAAMNGIRDFLTGPALTAVLDAFFSIVFIAIMFYYNITLTWIALVAVPFLLLQNIISTPIYRKRLDKVWAAGAESNAFLVETVTGMHTVKSLALEPQFKYKWEQLLAKYVRATFSNETFNIIINNSGSLIQRLSGFSVLWFGGHMVMAGQITIGELIAFQMLAGQANDPLLRLVGMWQSCQQSMLSVNRLGDILNTRPEPTKKANVSVDSVTIQGFVNFENLSFRYNLDAPQVLKGINVSIKPGMKVGIVGRSGSGKSTLTKLIQRLYLPETGRVLIDGIDIAEADPGWLRRQIGVVLQENYLFNSSVRENIAMTCPSASMDEVIKAAHIAGAHEFILELPEGYDTKVGERGTALSGGQRQRIAIARALLPNPRILIFDEATSALDYQSECIIMKNMDKIAAGRTMLMIAHRLSTVRRCDTIIVLDKGQIAEQGTHDELMKYQGLYYNLYIQQEV